MSSVLLGKCIKTASIAFIRVPNSASETECFRLDRKRKFCVCQKRTSISSANLRLADEDVHGIHEHVLRRSCCTSAFYGHEALGHAVDAHTEFRIPEAGMVSLKRACKLM